MFVFNRNLDLCEQSWYMQAQWKAYFGSFTTLTLDEAYDIWVRPGKGGKKWNAKEKALFRQIFEMSGGQENPYCCRLMPDVVSETAKPEDVEALRSYLAQGQRRL